jgi:hypothetical protein
MRGGMLWYYGGTAFYIYNNTVLLRMDEMPSENVGLRWRRHVYCSIDLPGYRFVGS